MWVFSPTLSSHFELRFECALCACLQQVVLGECSLPRELSNACLNIQNDLGMDELCLLKVGPLRVEILL